MFSIIILPSLFFPSSLGSSSIKFQNEKERYWLPNLGGSQMNSQWIPKNVKQLVRWMIPALVSDFPFGIGP